MALSANTTLTFIRGEQSQAPVKGSTTIYEGGMLGLTSGYARELVAGDLFLGHALEYIDNSSGSDGDLQVKIMRGTYRLQVTLSDVAITDVGSRVFASADDTLTLTPGSNSMVGVVARYVTTDTAIVEFQTSAVAELASDLTALLSNMATVSGASDFTVLQSDITALKSDDVVIKSDVVEALSSITVNDSDTDTNTSDIVVLKSDITSNDSDITVLKSDMTSEKSDTVVFKSDIVAIKSDGTIFKSDITAKQSNIDAHVSDLKVAISDAIVAFDAGDVANASDLAVTIDEVLTAFSDALG